MSRQRVLYKFKSWRLKRNDPTNLVIERLVPYKDKDTGELKDSWQFYGYYSTLQSALNALADKIGFHSGSLDEAISEIREFRMTIERLMKGIDS
jgi:hypothetical protein